ncbi:unnamed protein product [Porites evermanni]|uniref:Hemicentin-1 n=1 Tax=Porites evermanni TaxID=104178 RepID=A0ABN8MJ04_9CNID|nr:unnamed protein product [Porites evermanni]
MGIELTEICFTTVDGGWSDWSAWSGCAAGICAGNQRIRTRTCTNPLPSEDGAWCTGENAEQLDCMIDGGYTEWSQWSLCEEPCGGSVVNRTRTCTNPTPTADGNPCSGDAFQTKLECTSPCATSPLDGEWGPWTPWTQCSQTCGISGGSILSRTRLCNQPPPMNGGKPCVGNDTETAKSCLTPCPVDGGFSLWSTWTTCSATCGTGTQSRNRTCTNPVPASNGLNCTGDYSEATSCKIASCPGAIDGGFSEWSNWTACSEPQYCLQGFSKRTRTCTNPPPANGGDDCVGLSVENKDCPTQADGCTVYQPSKPDKTSVDPKSWIALECGATEKFSATGAYKEDVPSAVYSNFDFMKTELESGWFAIKIEADDQDDYGIKNLTKVCFEIIDPLTIKKVVDNKATYYSTIDVLPEWTRPNETENVPAISIWIDDAEALRKYEFQCSKADEYSPLSGYKITDVRFSYYTEGNSQTFKAKGDYTLETGNVFASEVWTDVQSGGVYAEGTADSATFEELMSSHGVNPVDMPDYFVDALEGAGLWDFTLEPVEYLRKLEKTGIYRITGSFDIVGVPIHVEVLTGVKYARPQFAVGFSFDQESYGKLSEQLSGIGVDFLDVIGLNLEIGISFQVPEILGIQQLAVDAETTFSKEPLHSLVTTSVPNGIYAAAQLVLPKDCKNNKFCEIVKMILGPTVKWYITGNFEWKKIKVATGFANIRICEGLSFSKLELYVEAEFNNTHTHTKMGFHAEIEVPVNGEIERDGIKAPGNELFLFGVLEYDFLEQEVAGKLGMRGMWRKAYWIDWLSMGDIFVGLTYKVGAPIPITGVQFGMAVEFGYDCLIPADFNDDGHCFGGSGYVGVGEPQFFYASITALTLGKVFRLFGATFQLPPPIAATGFPEGAESSYATADFDLRVAGGPYIYQGFMIKGTVNILGWGIFAHVTLSETAIFVDLKPDPVDILGIAKIVRSPTNSSQGPWFYVDARQSPPYLEAYIEGYTELLGISTYCRMNLTMTHMELLLQGDFLGLIKAEVFVSASYSLTFDSAEFYVRVTVDLDGINEALDEAAKAVQATFDAAEKELRNAREAVVEAKEDCKRQMSLKCDNCKNLKCKEAEENCKGHLDAAGKWISKNILAPVGKAVKKVFKGWKKKRGLEKLRNDNFAQHLRRRRFVSKFICEGIVGGSCEGIAHLCEGTCKLVEAIGKGLCNVMDVAVGFLKLTEMATAWVGSAINFILTAFRVNSIKMEFALATYAAGGFPDMIFSAGVDLEIFGKSLYLSIAFNLNDPVGSLKVGADSSTEWYKNKMNKENPTDTSENYYDNPNPHVDFQLSEHFLIENQQSATDDRYGPCLYVDSDTDGALIKVTGCNETDERQSWYYTPKGQVKNSYSQLCIDTNGASQGTNLIQSTCDERQDDQNFQCDLAVRSIKRRRADQCWTLGSTSVNGPGSLVHFGSLKCIHPVGGGDSVSEGNKLMIFAGCSESRLEFKLDNGSLIHTASGKCVQPVGEVTDGVALGLYSSCGGHQFSFTTGGSLQHVGSRKCVNTQSGVMLPANNDEIVLSSACENTDFSTFKEHLKFNFIPTDPYVHLDKCTHFDQARLDQRFEVVNEIAASICSKFDQNLALKKTTEQSSTDNNGFSSRAVDDNLGPYYDSKSCTHTKQEENPWWRVDLGREYIVTDVQIINRFNHYERLKNFEVRVGVNEDNLQNPTCSDRVTSVGQGAALTLSCDPPIPGRYVSVQMFGEGILSMCEVMVYSRVGALADLCQLDNGGCQQVCYNLCNLKVQCDCWPGYTLAYDGKTCMDKDECQSNNGGCDYAHGLCINTPGSYHCACKQGYELQENSLFLCEDFNECNLNNAGCEHVCNNTGGSFNCDCRAGFKLKDDLRGCEDVDECAEADEGGCEHTCTNYEGGYYCSCNDGYRLMGDDKSCEEIYCPALEAPFRGSISPSSCTDDRANIQRDTACTYGCESGHYVTGGNNSLTCQIDGFWQGTVPYCKPVVCPKLTVPDQGGVVPASCSMTDVEYGTRCVFYCDDGYQLSGPRYTTCQNDTSWSEIASLSCVQVYTDPWISCPIDRVEELEPNKSTVVLGYKWQLPRTNMDSVSVSPSNYDENYPFPVGRHRVTWTGISDSGTHKSCSFHITVNDVTPPTVQNCPSNITDSTNSLQKSVTWTPPTFTDNVAVVSVLSNREPGFIMDTYTSLTVQYTSSDAAGNVVYCTFDITLEGTTCPIISHPNNGLATQFGLFLQLTCNSDYFFNPQPPGYTDLFINPSYRCEDNKWVSMNSEEAVLSGKLDCMKYVTYSGSPCLPGSILVDDQVCLNCPPGTYGDSESNTCKECGIGFYQDEEGKPELTYQIPIFTAICRTGKYSTNNGVCPCKKCPLGTYQDTEQMTSCKACPAGTNTLQNGSQSINDCVAPVQITEIVPNADLNVIESDTFSILCNVEGSPAPDATWNKTAGSLPMDRTTINHIYDLEAKLTGVEMVITGAVVSDSGTYECKATNTQGTVTKQIYVQVDAVEGSSRRYF